MFRSLFPEKHLTMHLPNNDTLATTHIYQMFLEKTAGW